MEAMPISAGILTDRMFYADGGGGSSGATLALQALFYDSANEMVGVDTGMGSLTNTCSTTHYAPDTGGLYQLFGVNDPIWVDGRVALTGGAGTEVTNTYADDVSDVLLTPLPSLKYEPAATNSQIQSNDGTTGWKNDSTVIRTFDQAGLTGAANTATYLEDNNTGSLSGINSEGANDTTLIANTDTNTAVFYFDKGSTICEISLQQFGGTAKSILLLVDRSDGSASVFFSQGTVSHEVIDLGDWWKVCISCVSSSNTLLRTKFKPAASSDGTTEDVTATGSAILGNIEVHLNKTIAKVRDLGPIFTTTAAASTVAVDPISIPVANHSDTDGLYYCEWTPSYTTSEAAGDQAILSLNGAIGLLYYDATNGMFEATDGTNVVTATKTIVAGTTYQIALTYHATEAKMQLSVDATDGTEGTYDGGFATTGDLEFAGGGTYSSKLRDLRRYDISSMTDGATQRDLLLP